MLRRLALLLPAALFFACSPAHADTCQVLASSPSTTAPAVVQNQCDTSGNLKVNIVAGSGSVPTGAAGTPSTSVVTVQGIAGATPQPVSIDHTTPGTTDAVVAAGNVASAAADSGNPVKIGGVYNSTSPSLTTGQRGDLQLDVKGHVKAQLFDNNDSATALGTNHAPSDGYSNSLAQAASVIVWPHLYNGTTWDRMGKPISASTVRLLSAAATTNATVVKASAGQLFMIEGQNAKASAIYLKLYAKATAPTCGTDTPLVTLYLAASAHFTFSFPTPLYFATGIGFCITGAAADADTTALAAGDVLALNAFIQ